MTITNANGQYIGEAPDLPARPAGPWLTNEASGPREGIENPRVRFRPSLMASDTRIDEIRDRITARMMARRAA